MLSQRLQLTENEKCDRQELHRHRSDGTIVTTDVGKKLELRKCPVTLAETIGIGGKPEVRILYAAIFTIKGMEVVTAVDIRDDVKEVLLGRDILHHLRLTIDWKKKIIDLKDP